MFPFFDYENVPIFLEMEKSDFTDAILLAEGFIIVSKLRKC